MARGKILSGLILALMGVSPLEGVRKTRLLRLQRGEGYAAVIHTFEWLAGNRTVRMISERRPTRAEIRDYEEQA